MSGFKIATLIAGALALVGLVFTFIVLIDVGARPWSLGDRAIPPRFLDDVRAAVGRGEAWPDDPAAVARRLQRFGATDEDPGHATIDVVERGRDRAVVEIHERVRDDDSVTETFRRITLARADDGWLPTSHRSAQKGRGVVGWTTGSTY